MSKITGSPPAPSFGNATHARKGIFVGRLKQLDGLIDHVQKNIITPRLFLFTTKSLASDESRADRVTMDPEGESFRPPFYHEFSPLQEEEALHDRQEYLLIRQGGDEHTRLDKETRAFIHSCEHDGQSWGSHRFPDLQCLQPA